MAESDEASRFQTPRGLEAASEAGVGQDRTWGQGDVAIRGGSVWQSGAEVAQGNDVRLGREGRGRGGSGDEYPIESTQPKTVSRGEVASLSATILPGPGRAAGTRAGRDTNTPRKNWSGGEFNERGVSAAFTRGTALGSRGREGEGEGWTESGGSSTSGNEIITNRATGALQVEGETGGLRRSSRAKSSWTPFPEEDCCQRRRLSGALSAAARSHLPT